jgi:hypothetical protein
MQSETKLGPCCGCEGNEAVNNILMLSRRGPSPGYGWGCVVCNLPPDGAVAVLCDKCAELYKDNPAIVRFVCRHYPSSGGRASIDELPAGNFDHDPNVPH